MGERVNTPSDRVEVKQGERVRIIATSDKDEVIHVHGYDRKVALSAGIEGILEFTADIPGVFEVEFEKSGKRAFDLLVR